jgi:hypothetical protein
MAFKLTRRIKKRKDVFRISTRRIPDPPPRFHERQTKRRELDTFGAEDCRLIKQQ